MIKKLFLIFFFSTSYCHSMALGTLAYFQFFTNSIDSVTNNFILTQQGTVPFTVISNFPTSGQYSDSNYWNTQSGLNVAMQGLTTYTIEAYVNTTSLSGGNMIWTTQDANTYFEIDTNGTLKLDTGNVGQTLSTVTTLSINTWYDVAFTWNNTNRQIWINNVSSASDSNSGTLTSVTMQTIGRYPNIGGLNFKGYIYGMRFSNVARTTFPTIDPKIINSGTTINSGSVINNASIINNAGSSN